MGDPQWAVTVAVVEPNELVMVVVLGRHWRQCCTAGAWWAGRRAGEGDREVGSEGNRAGDKRIWYER